MAASTAGALKVLIEGAGLGLSAYRHRAPEGQAYPHVVIHEAISITPEPAFSQFDDSQDHVNELVQIDLWQRWKNADGTLAESYSLADTLARTLRGSTLTAAPFHVSGLRLINGPIRDVEVEENLIHDSYTLEVHRVLERS
jgi:hypothetical protein